MRNRGLKLKVLTQLKLTYKFRMVFRAVGLMALVLYSLIYFNLGTPKMAAAGTETIATGSYIVNMGIVPQTYNNGLRPYGMIYDLMTNYSVKIKWVIEPTKSKDGTDFTYNAVSYKGGTFIVPRSYISAAVSARIAYWVTQGISGVYTTSSISVPVYATLESMPHVIIDTVSGKENIIEAYFTNAMIPSTAYQEGSPSLLTPCHDLWVNPHGDPTWASHGYLYDLTMTYKSFVWEQCHAVSVTEGVNNASIPYKQLNFLSTNGLKCYSNNQCGAGVLTHNGNPTTPFTHNYPADPVMQFMGTMDGATGSGSEKWYQPQATGAWRSTTLRLVTTADGTSPNEGVEMVYGPAFGDPTNGYVMYEGGHDLTGSGTTAEKVAAQRAFLNYMLLAGFKKLLNIASVDIQSTIYSAETKAISVTVDGGTPTYSYAWSSDIGGTFANPNAASTTYKAPTTSINKSGNITCTVTDYCGRQKSTVSPIAVYNTLPITLKSFNGNFNHDRVDLKWIVATEINNDYFTIERSIDGVNYLEIGKVKGSKNSTSDKRYDYTDYSPGDNKNYYRLNQTDFDGTSKTFNPIFVKGYSADGRSFKTLFQPNPFSEKLKIDYYAEQSGIITLTLLDRTGNPKRSQQFDCIEGMNSFQVVDLDNLFPGIYYAILARNNTKEVIKLLKY